jgi:outer membrane immunogenic protein
MTRFLIGALVAGVATSALAADLPYRPEAPYAPAYVAPFTWTGVYFGLNAGYGWASTSNDSFGSLSGGAIGATVGGNLQMGQFVVGAEGDWDWAGLSHTQSLWLTSNHMNVDQILTLRARGGMALGRTLIFVTGGYAGVSTNGTFSTPLAGWGGSQNQWISGGVIGAGVEYAFTNNITAKAEYLYLPLSSTTYFNSTFYSTRAPVDMSLLRAGVNYKF